MIVIDVLGVGRGVELVESRVVNEPEVDDNDINHEKEKLRQEIAKRAPVLDVVT